MALINRLPPCWRDQLIPFIRDMDDVQEAMRDLETVLEQENPRKTLFHPDSDEVFAAFEATHFNNVKVVIIGHEPYSQEYATGLAFSAPNNLPMPISAARIYCALATNIGGKIPVHDNFRNWAGQGVLLLNRALTIQADNSQIVKNNWFIFTDAILQMLFERSARPLHFMLWGGKAKDISSQIINRNGRHFVHETDHPSAPNVINSNAFRNCGYFSAVNNELRIRERPEQEIDWFDPILRPRMVCDICDNNC